MKSPVNGYDLAYLAIMPPAAAMLAYKMWKHGKYRESAPAMLGMALKDEDKVLWENGCVWVHAVSVGEVIAARAMLPLLRKQFHPLPILLTTHTETGQATARTLPEGLVDAVRYYPLDLSCIIRKYVDVYKPKVFIPMETELWPNALRIIGRSGAKIFTLNGKISDNSFRNYQKIGGLIRKTLSNITAFCVQTEADRQRISTLLGSSDNVHVTGNCKFDLPIETYSPSEKEQLASQLGVHLPARLLVVGSTHPGEEELILDAYDKVRADTPDVKLVLVPRHPERFAEVWKLLQQRGLSARRSSDGATTGNAAPQIFLVDQMGLLSKLYSLAEVAVVAGSFVPGIGGHNILEPAAHGVPVVYGPYMKSQPDMARILSPENGGTVTDAEGLSRAISQLLLHPDIAHEKALRGQQALLSNQGSAQRNMEIISRYLSDKAKK